MIDPMRGCLATKEDGSRCQSRGQVSAEGFCIWHDKQRRHLATAMRQKGGETSRNQVKAMKDLSALPSTTPPRTLAEAHVWAGWATLGLASGALDPGRARELSSILRVLVTTAEKVELEKRLAAIEQLVGKGAR